MTEPSGIKAVEVLRRIESAKGSTPTPQPSAGSLSDTRQSPQEFAKAMVLLVALKRTVSLTEAQIDAWYAVLGHFPARIMNAAIIELVLTEERFPEVSDLYAICRRKLPKQYSPLGDGREAERPSNLEIQAVASRLGLDV